MKKSKVAQFVDDLGDTEKLEYSRETYRFMIKDPAFAKQAPYLNLTNADTNDRFLFLYLCRAMREDLSDESYKELASYIYYLREVSLPLKVSSTGISTRPDTQKWRMSDTEDDGVKMFSNAWNVIPKEFRIWMRETFDALPNKLHLVAA